jgi:hypothetical protein
MVTDGYLKFVEKFLGPSNDTIKLMLMYNATAFEIHD